MNSAQDLLLELHKEVEKRVYGSVGVSLDYEKQFIYVLITNNLFNFKRVVLYEEMFNIPLDMLAFLIVSDYEKHILSRFIKTLRIGKENEKDDIR